MEGQCLLLSLLRVCVCVCVSMGMWMNEHDIQVEAIPQALPTLLFEIVSYWPGAD